jgi:hypothetical protein
MLWKKVGIHGSFTWEFLRSFCFCAVWPLFYPSKQERCHLKNFSLAISPETWRGNLTTNNGIVGIFPSHIPRGNVVHFAKWNISIFIYTYYLYIYICIYIWLYVYKGVRHRTKWAMACKKHIMDCVFSERPSWPANPRVSSRFSLTVTDQPPHVPGCFSCKRRSSRQRHMRRTCTNHGDMLSTFLWGLGFPVENALSEFSEVFFLLDHGHPAELVHWWFLPDRPFGKWRLLELAVEGSCGLRLSLAASYGDDQKRSSLRP